MGREKRGFTWEREWGGGEIVIERRYSSTRVVKGKESNQSGTRVVR